MDKVRIWTAILAGLQIFSAGTILTEVFPAEYVGLFVLAVAALQGGTIFYMKSGQPYSPEHAWEER